jgi:hypothetical protein
MISEVDWNIVIALGTAGSVVLAIISGQWKLSNFISDRFSKVYDRIDHFKDSILDKLEYHERHDDKRFEEIRRDLFTIQLRSAADPKWLEKRETSYPRNETSDAFGPRVPSKTSPS